jgi:hypothetical protein
MKHITIDRSKNPSSAAPVPIPTVDIDRATAIWDEYKRNHDITPLIDQTAGIEPISGRIWFGETAIDVHDKMMADGMDAPFYAVRVGYDYYLRKGTRS